MNLLVVLGVFALIALLLVLLHVWQGKIEDVERKRVIADIRDAQERGTSRPIAQHPQIDVQACIGCGSCIAVCPEDGVLGLVDGIAHVIHGSRCVGHGRCAEACPVAAVKIGLGEISLRPDIPLLSESLESSVPGVYVAGELGGFSLIRNAVRQGALAVEEIANDLGRAGAGGASSDAVDVLIVGAGPAGFAASLKAVERGLSYATIDREDIGGTVRKYPRRKLILTGPLVLPIHGRVKKREFLKEELIGFWNEVVDECGIEIRTGVRFSGLEGTRDAFVAGTSAGPIAARRVLLALGRRGTPRKLGVPGEEQEKVLYQLIEAATYEGERLLVVGGGDSAVEAATALASQPENEVTLSYRRGSFFRLKRRNEERVQRFVDEGKVRVIFNSEVRRIDPLTVALSCREDDVERTVEIENDYVFVCAGGEPPYPLLRKIGVRFTGGGEKTSLEPEQVTAER